MSKGFLVMDMPKNCLECPLLYKADKLPLGDFKYQILYRCRIEPEGIEDVYLEDMMHKRQDWCPLRPMPEKINYEPGMSLVKISMMRGWNACINAIGGNDSE